MLNKKRVLIIPIEIFYNLDMLAYKVKKVTQNEFSVNSLKFGNLFRSLYGGTRRAILSQATPDLISTRGRRELLQYISYTTDIVVLTYKCARQLALVISDQLDFDEHMLISSKGIRDVMEKYPDLLYVNMNVVGSTDAASRMLKTLKEEEDVKPVTKNKTRKKTTRKTRRSSNAKTGGTSQATSEGGSEEKNLGETGGYMGVVLEKVTDGKEVTANEETLTNSSEEE